MKTRKAVIDLGFGDSGKGTVTAYLCHTSKNPLVIRYSGGHQAGHTVIHKGKRHVFSSFGSGTMQGIPTYWKANTFYPKAFLNELSELHEIGVQAKIYVHGKCPVTTPYDVWANRKRNDELGHGSCGVGYGTTIQREEDFYSLLVEDLKFSSVVKMKLDMICQYYGHRLEEKEEKAFLTDCYVTLDYIDVVSDDKIYEIMKNHNTLIFESSQGLMLDQNIGFFPHVSRGYIGSNVILGLDEVWYVTRAYQTRHGNGPMTNEHIGHNIKKNPYETNVDNYQGTFRRSILDLDLLEYALYKDNSDAKQKNLVITCLDHIENEWRFTYKKQIIASSDENEFIEKIVDILDVDEVYLSRTDVYTNIKEWGE